MSHRHTASSVAAIRGTGKRQSLFDSEVRNLYLRVNGSGSDKTWYVQTRTSAGQRPHYRIGPADVFPPSEARKRAQAILRDALSAGDDLNARKKRERLELVRASQRTLRSFIQGRYAEEHLSHRPSGAATKARLLSTWAPLLDMDMTALSVAHIHALRSARLKVGVKPQTVNRDTVALKAALSKAVDWEILESHPLPRLRPLPTEDDKRVRYLSDDERVRLMAALRDPQTPGYLRGLTLLALHTGLRRGELVGARWRDIKGGVLHVVAGNSKVRKARHVPLNEAATAALAEWRGLRGNVVKLEGLIWPSPKGGERLTHFKRAWASLMRRAQITGFNFHDCRHDFASRLVQSRTDLYVVQQLLGHSSSALTQRYAHLAPDMLRRAVSRLG